MEARSVGERFFDTDAVRAELGRRSVRSSAVTLAARVAQMALFLASYPSAALTGQSFIVSHGWSMK